MKGLLRAAKGLALAAVLLAMLAGTVLACLGWVMRGPDPLSPAPRGLVLGNVVLVEPDHSRRPGFRLVVEADRIAQIEPASGASGADRFDGAFVLPGLVDAHAHLPPGFLPGQSEVFAFAFLAHGVTGIRVPADVHPGVSTEVRDAIEAGRYAGPRIETCGRFVDGPDPVFATAIVVETAAEARAAVDELARSGVDCVKAYNELDRETLTAIREAAARHDLPVIGHVPWRLSLEEARLDDVQHMLGFHTRTSARPEENMGGWLDVEDARVEEVIRALLEQDAAMTTSIVAARRISRARTLAEVADDPMHVWLPPFYADAIWRIPGGINLANQLDAAELDRMDRASARMAEAAARLYRAGVRLRAGTDTFAPPVVPGASLHEELALFVEGGLSPEEALAIATRGSARALRVDGLGELTVGAPADFVVYAEDPTRNLEALGTMLAVVQDGRVYSREAIDAQHARYRNAWAGSGHRHFVVPAIRGALGALLRQAAGVSEAGASGQ